MKTQSTGYKWLDKYIAKQHATHGDMLTRLLQEVAEAVEWFGDDELERYARMQHNIKQNEGDK